MYVLTVKAFSDFDVPYTVTIAAMVDGNKINNIAETLNKFCGRLPDKDNDVRLKKYLSHANWVEELKNDLRTGTTIDNHNMDLLVNKLLGVCEHNYVYIYDNIFEVEKVVHLT